VDDGIVMSNSIDEMENLKHVVIHQFKEVTISESNSFDFLGMKINFIGHGLCEISMKRNI
jgi:hypothetical protein